MALGEIYIKLAVSFPNDPKVRALARYGADAGLARDLYVQMCLYCKDLLSDGFVPAEQVGLLVYPLDLEHGNQLAKQLASVGLTKEVSNQEASDKQGWEVCSFLKRNGTREDVERLSQVRAEAGRNGGIKSRKRPAQRPSKANGKQVANQDAQQKGSNTVSVSVEPDGSTTDRDSQTPTVSAGEAGLSVTQRAKRITDAYDVAVPMCKWPAVNAVVIRAINAEAWTDEAVRDALMRHAADNRPVTIDSLRTELDGIAPRIQASRSSPSAPGSAADQRRADVARLREIDRQQREGNPPGTIQGSVSA